MEHHVHGELRRAGTPSHLEGPALVVLPRTCIVNPYGASVDAAAHGPGVATLMHLRRAVDSMVAGSRSTPHPVEACAGLPDLSGDVTRLASLHASNDGLALMRTRDVRHLVVIEVAARVSCYDTSHNGSYSSFMIPAGATLNSEHRCDAAEIALSAFVFDRSGTALWASTRSIDVGSATESEVERLVRRIPVKVPVAIAAPEHVGLKGVAAPVSRPSE
jgi:hypothetical protein